MRPRHVNYRLDRAAQASRPVTPWRTGTLSGQFVEYDAAVGVAVVQLDPDDDESRLELRDVTPGLYAPGADVTVTRAADGRPAALLPPVELPAGVEPIEVGPPPDTPGTALAQRLDTLGSTTRDLEQARQELDAAQQQLARELAQAEQQLTQDLGRVDGQYTVSDQAPHTHHGTGKPVGAMWEHRSNSGQIIGRYVWTGVVWAAAPLHGAAIANSSVTADKIVASRELWARVANFAAVTTQMLTAGHARITAELLAERIRLATQIIAGDPEGTHTVLDPTGLRVKRQVAPGQVAEVVRLGVSDTADYLGVVDASGRLLASIDDSGRVASQSLAVAGQANVESLVVDSRTLEEIIDSRLPRLIARVDKLGTFWYSSGQNKTPNTPYPLFEFSVTNPFDKALAVMVEPPTLTVYATGVGRISAAWWATANGSTPTAANTFEGVSQNAAVKGDVAITLPHLATNIGPGVTWRIRCVVTGTVAWNLSRNETVRSYLVSLGVDDTDYGGRSELLSPGTGGAPLPPPPVRRRYTKDYTGTWGGSYALPDGRAAPAMDPMAVQGYGGGPQRMGMIGFQSMTADLSGAVIEKVEVYLYYQHWWNNSGGTASIGYHDKTSKPAWWSGTHASITKGGVPRASGVWITLPSSTHEHWKSGRYRGITVRAPGDTTDRAYYGYVDPARCRIRVTYLK